MDGEPLEPEDHDAHATSADLIVIDDGFGTALIGTDDALGQYMESLNAPVVVARGESGVCLAGFKGEVFGTRSVKTAYSLAKLIEVDVVRPDSGAHVTYHRMVRDATTGKIVSNARIPDPRIAAAGLGPQMAAVVALEAAIAAQFDEIHERLDAIEDKVDAILQLAHAERIGDVYGHHRVLTGLVREIRRGHVLSATDWSTIAPLGVDLAVGVERLRAHVVKQIEALDSTGGPAKRAEQLEKMLRSNRVADTLKLLVVAQKSLFMWQNLRLEQVRLREAEFLDQTLVSARDRIREQYHVDVDLVTRLREVIGVFAVLRVTEVHHVLSGRTLTKLGSELDSMLTEFVNSRNLQMTDWGLAEHARIADALAAVRVKAGEIVVEGRRQIVRGAVNVAAWVEPKSDGDLDAVHTEVDDPWVKK